MKYITQRSVESFTEHSSQQNESLLRVFPILAVVHIRWVVTVLKCNINTLNQYI